MNAWRWGLLGLALAALACGPRSSGPTDRDGDGVEREEDCDDENAAVWQLVSVHADSDRDRRGAGPLVEVCAGADTPPGWSSSADDCDDGDAYAWQLVSTYVDGDGDGRGVEPSVELCVGSVTPSGYASTSGDCDDAQPLRWQLEELYADADGDAVGAGALVTVCSGDSVPDGWSRSGDDCAPQDQSRWRELVYTHRDADGDGRTSPEIGTVCSGEALPTGYSMEDSGEDCDDLDPFTWIAVAGYRDEDDDGWGAGSLVEQCTAGSLPPGWVSVGGDCAPADRKAWWLWSYQYRDADGDGATVQSSGQLCLPGGSMPGYSDSIGPRGNDCDDSLASAWQLLPGYADADHDGEGAGTREQVCSGDTLPAGWSKWGNDCAADDPLRWRSFGYSYRDKDGDGSAMYSPGTVCYGDERPSGYLGSATPILDCNDDDPAVFQSLTGYVDQDVDGVGAGVAIVSCTAGALPAGQRPTGTDCAPADASRWQSLAYKGIDADADGMTIPASGAVCTGAALPAPYVAAARGNDCKDDDPAVWRWVVLYPDHDGDGIGAPPREIPCLGADLPPGLVPWGWDPDDGNPLVRAEAEEDLLDLLW